MNGYAARRPLADLIVELADSFAGFTGADPAQPALPVRPVSFECRLPIESTITLRDDGVQLFADLPATVTRTTFDRPINGLSVHIAAEPVS